MVKGDVFSPGERDRFQALRHADHYMIVHRFRLVLARPVPHRHGVARPNARSAACVRSIAGMGWFSTDRAICEYAKSVWHARFSPAAGSIVSHTPSQPGLSRPPTFFV
jgi:starch phosphorylase